MIRWQRLPPAEPCTSPDGHSPADVMSSDSHVPVMVFCRRCNLRYTVVEDDVVVWPIILDDTHRWL